MPGRYGRTETLIRALAIVRLLESRREWTLYELAERFGVTTRTVRRDLHAIEAAGYRLEVTRGWTYGDERGRWRLARKERAV